jgi:glycogen synthase
MSAKAAQQVARFSWDASARQHCEIYRQALQI